MATVARRAVVAVAAALVAAIVAAIVALWPAADAWAGGGGGGGGTRDASVPWLSPTLLAVCTVLLVGCYAVRRLRRRPPAARAE